MEGKTLKEKMLEIMDCLKRRGDFEIKEHKTETYGQEEVGYYYSYDGFFHFVYEGVTVCVTGEFKFEKLEDIYAFDFDIWIIKLSALVAQKTCTLDGKEYFSVEVKA